MASEAPRSESGRPIAGPTVPPAPASSAGPPTSSSGPANGATNHADNGTSNGTGTTAANGASNGTAGGAGASAEADPGAELADLPGPDGRNGDGRAHANGVRTGQSDEQERRSAELPAEVAAEVAAESDDTPPTAEAEGRPGLRGRMGRRAAKMRTFESMQDRRFRAYFLAMLGAMSSQNMQMVVRGYIAYDITGSYTALGTISLANAMPGLAFAVIGGTIADRVPYRRQIVQWCQAVNAVASLAICVFAFAGVLDFQQLFVTALVQGTSMAIMMPARQALIGSLVEPRLLMNAVALNSAGMNAARLFAPAIGGVLLAWVGVAWVYFLMTALWSIASIYMARVPEPRREVAKLGRIGAEIKAGLTNMKEGIVYCWQHPIVGPVLGLNVLITITAMPYQFLLAGFVQDVFNEGADTVGLLQSVIGVSSLIGALVIASVNWGRRGLVFLLGSALQGALLLCAFWLSSSVLMMGAFLFGMGFGQAARQSLSNVLVQSYGDESYRGRIMSIYMLQFSLAQVGAFITGVLAEALGARLALSATSLGLVVISLGGVLLFPKLRKLP